MTTPQLPAPAAPSADLDKLNALAPLLIGKDINGHKITSATVNNVAGERVFISVGDDQGGTFKMFADGTTSYAGKIGPNHTIDGGSDNIITLPGIPKWFNILFPGLGNIDQAVESAGVVSGKDNLGKWQKDVTNTITKGITGLPAQIAAALKGLISLPFFVRIGEGLLAILILVIGIYLYMKDKT